MRTFRSHTETGAQARCGQSTRAAKTAALRRRCRNQSWPASLSKASERRWAAGTRLQAIKIGADIVSGQVQHLAPKAPVLLDLRLGFRGPSGEFPTRVAGLRDPVHGCLERRMLKREMNAEARTEVGVAIGLACGAIRYRLLLPVRGVRCEGPVGVEDQVRVSRGIRTHCRKRLTPRHHAARRVSRSSSSIRRSRGSRASSPDQTFGRSTLWRALSDSVRRPRQDPCERSRRQPGILHQSLISSCAAQGVSNER
jgi:hypothetical protein